MVIYAWEASGPLLWGLVRVSALKTKQEQRYFPWMGKKLNPA